MLTIGQLAAYAGVTVRAVRHYHQIGLLPEPERDASGYRRYGATAVVSLIKIRALANAGVPLSRIGQMLEADPSTFAEAVRKIDSHLREEIERLDTSRKQIAQLAAGDSLALPPEVVAFLDRLREIGVSERLVEGERDGWILVAARWPDNIREVMPMKLAQLQDPRFVRLFGSCRRCRKVAQTMTRVWRKSPTSWPPAWPRRQSPPARWRTTLSRSTFWTHSPSSTTRGRSGCWT
ncbi:MerR family transcriptional regulator [Nonomuraea sp. NPDC002799]